MTLKIERLTEDKLEECVDVFIDTFTKEPWNDVYDSREQVVTFIKNHLANNYFLGYLGIVEEKIVALSIGMKKPWIEGMEYYVDEFCVHYECQGKGIGTQFLNEIIADLSANNLNGILLNTEKDYPAEAFYLKNGFKVQQDLIVLAR